MGIAGFGPTSIDYATLDRASCADEARRLGKCERIYHRGQQLAWDGKDILPMLIAEHGGIEVKDPAVRGALQRIFSIILWGELAAWKISAQLADGLVPLEAKMAATSQAFDEARHFYVMNDYLVALGDQPQHLDRAPQALLDLVLDTDELPHKLLGMQLMIEPIALTIFQTVRELNVEPVLSDLLRYFEKDEARHVGLGMQYLPSMMAAMNKAEISRLLTFQARLIAWALWELKVLEDDFRVLGLDPRVVVDRGRRKQLAALSEAFEALGMTFEDNRNTPTSALMGVCELVFPVEEVKDRWPARLRAAWDVFAGQDEEVGLDEYAVHDAHRIKTARGTWSDAAE